MIGQMVIAITLLGVNDLGRSVTPTFLLRNILFTIISSLSKNEQKIKVGSLFFSFPVSGAKSALLLESWNRSQAKRELSRL